MKWNSLISTQNLKLAWRRINTATNLQYKRFFRESYLVYESAVDEHIKLLHKELKEQEWQPDHSTRLYIPKPSGLQRPLSLLGIEDQILLQAIANLFAKKLYEKRKSVELKTVFSNKLSAPKDSIFFVERWQKTYRAFQEKCTRVFHDGYIWSVHFDLSAFYDTISHSLLLSVESPNDKDSHTRSTVKEWLQKWSAESNKTVTDHGIPQGPISSNFLAEAFLLPIDIRLQKEKFQYLRYVDDIRLFGRTENEVRKAVIFLEQVCRERGLTPQGSKFEVSKLRSAKDAMGALPSIAPTDEKDATESAMTAGKAVKILKTAIAGRPQKVQDKARFRYVMYRAPSDAEFLKTVLRLLPRHPEHIDAFVAYFSNFEKRHAIVRAALNYLEEGVPYSYVRGELWHVVARLAGVKELKRGLPVARQDAQSRSHCMALSWGVMHFLMQCEKKGIFRIGKQLDSEHPISRSLLAPIFCDREFSARGHIGTLLKGTLMEQLAAARELQKREITLHKLNLKQKSLPDHCKIALRSLGVIRRLHRTNTDYIERVLVRLYGCQPMAIWRNLFGSEYEHALQILKEAEARFSSAPSNWLGLQDSFNHIFVRQFLEFLRSKNLDGYSKTINRNGEKVRYGTLIAAGESPFNTAYPDEVSAFRELHIRRNIVPGSHPYDPKGEQSKWLEKKEQKILVRKLKYALDSFAKVVKQNS